MDGCIAWGKTGPDPIRDEKAFWSRKVKSYPYGKQHKNIAEECLDDVPALASYHQALMDGSSTATYIRRMKEAVIQELDENEAA